MFESIVAVVGPYIVEIVVALFTIYIAPKLDEFLNLKSDDSRRLYVESAMVNAIVYAVRTVKPNSDGGYYEPAILDAATEYMKKTVPEALKGLKITDEGLRMALSVRFDIFEAAREGLENIEEGARL